ncbi:hypothetical protein ABIE69_001078 [Rhodobacteraceae bacterium MBR-64]|jgi:hypothetical protein
MNSIARLGKSFIRDQSIDGTVTSISDYQGSVAYYGA